MGEPTLDVTHADPESHYIHIFTIFSLYKQLHISYVHFTRKTGFDDFPSRRVEREGKPSAERPSPSPSEREVWRRHEDDTGSHPHFPG